MRLLWSVLLLLVLVPGWSGSTPNDHLGPVARMAVTPVEIRAHDRDRAGARRVGRLTFLRGYRLTSPDSAFGGFSSLTVEGDRFTLLSDSGEIVRFRLDANGRLGASAFTRLPAGPGTGWGKEDRDSESMTRDPATGQVWVGFEHWNAIWRYAPGFARGERQVQPAAMRDWPANGGPESMIRLRSGAFLVFAEQMEGPAHKGAAGKGRVALRFDGDPTTVRTPPVRFTYMPPADMDPSDAVELPDGSIMLLNRQFKVPEGFVVAVTIIDPAAIRAGATVQGKEIARFQGDVLHDNYEGIAVGYENGQPVLWIVSDDNQSVFQQSLLLEFRLNPAPAKAQGR